MMNLEKIYDVIEYTDEDLKDTEKYNEYTETLSDLIDLIESTPMVKTLVDAFYDDQLVDQLDELLEHADDVYSSAHKCVIKESKDDCRCKNTGSCHKYSVEDLVNEYLKQSEIQKSFTKPVHYYQAYHLLSDFAEFVLNK